MSRAELASVDSTLNARFRGHDSRDWSEWSAFRTEDADEVPLDAERAWLNRVKASHRGIGDRRAVTHLIAGATDQSYLDEICTMTGLERLELEWPVTAKRLDGLVALKRLRHLSIDSPRHVTDFTPLLDLPSLKTLLLTNAKHMADVAWLADAHHLEVIGIEGSMWTVQKIPTLQPLAGLRGMRAFLATSTRLADHDLTPLADCPSLEFLSCARVAPREEFERLHESRPDLHCTWFHADWWS